MTAVFDSGLKIINCFTDPLPLASLLIEHGAAITDRVRCLGEGWNAEAFRNFLTKYRPHD